MSDILTYCRPEEVGVKPEWVEAYVDRVNGMRKACHSFLMMRGTKVFAEGYFKPFHKDFLHRMYSVSKTFVSAAIGMLIDEGKIALDDKIVKYFPDMLPEGGVHPYIEEMTIRDMLLMATCHHHTTYAHDKENWTKTFFNPPVEPDHRAGTEFRYDTSATYTLDVLVERITGKTFLEYLKDKALLDIGFSKNSWCIEAPEGYAWGGSGVMCTTRDLARFAYLFASKGEINGKRYLSESYINEATSPLIDNNKGNVDEVAGNGYGYQIWCGKGKNYAFLGMGGQMAVIIPDKDIIFTCTSDTQGDADGYHVFANILLETVVNKIESDTLPKDDAAFARLSAKLSALEMNVPNGELTSPIAAEVYGKTYTLGDNPMGIGSFRIETAGGTGLVTFETDRGTRLFPFCLGRYADTVFPETHYSGKRMFTPKGEGYRCLNAAVWESENTLLLRTYVIDDFFGNMAARFTFDGENVTLKMEKTAEWFLDEYKGEAIGKKA